MLDKGFVIRCMAVCLSLFIGASCSTTNPPVQHDSPLKSREDQLFELGQEVDQFAPRGTPVAAAIAVLEENGYSCREYDEGRRLLVYRKVLDGTTTYFYQVVYAVADGNIYTRKEVEIVGRSRW